MKTFTFTQFERNTLAEAGFLIPYAAVAYTGEIRENMDVGGIRLQKISTKLGKYFSLYELESNNPHGNVWVFVAQGPFGEVLRKACKLTNR